ncbi:MAG TPA: hypothetical protein VLC09_01335 [Polyangiaceae bacterium]|nr:hypothetical protein [Polyangiaceae bacterium]
MSARYLAVPALRRVSRAACSSTGAAADARRVLAVPVAGAAAGAAAEAGRAPAGEPDFVVRDFVAAGTVFLGGT